MATSEARVAIAAHAPASASKRHHDGTAQKQAEGAKLGQGATVVTSLIAGAAAGAIAKTAIAPLDRAKINFQTSHIPYSARAVVLFLKNSARKEGFIALWRGNSATMARIVPYAAIQFTAHEQWKKLLRVDTPAAAKAHPIVHLVAGSLAGVTSQSLTYPLDLARARMAVTDASEYKTLRQVFVKVIQNEGARTLYRGYPATVLGVIPYAGASFFTYDSLKHKYLEIVGVMPSGWINMVFGGCAGALGQTASYPLDIVRRRMQTARRKVTGEYPYPDIVKTLREVYAFEGWRGFFKGLSMNWVKGPISVGISFATYDYIKSALRDVAVSIS
ncbi:hypothetical protein O0L34_g10633 [Tuta absoluta]|nr:hypothetical protein O0L34_g10633 [Tuta absoluta]